ncbi:MAG: methyltransferase domain-containing protein [Neomegalonema sp.]|nr:methyltransferase domain-containing protein [Neomegalonema sp.]
MGAYDYIPKLYNVRFEAPESGRQSDEYFLADIDGETRRFNIHNYDNLYSVPWLYDISIYHNLGCETPTEMSGAIAPVWRENDADGSGFSMLELGAGSGAFGHELRHTLKMKRLVGLDISAPASQAAERDRPGLYDAYHVADLTALSPELRAELEAEKFDVVGLASATGWGNHIPVGGFEVGFELLRSGGWFIFHVKPNDPDPECVALNDWVNDKIATGALVEKYRKSHFHRKSSGGGDIYYDVVIGVKA